MTPRNFKVMENLGDAKGSHLRFRGVYLVEAGFSPGASFTLSNIAPGKLLLEVTSPAPMTGKDFLAAVAPFERIGL
jgi:hypothetical protein